MVYLHSMMKLLPGDEKSGIEFIVRQLQVVIIFAFLYWIAGYIHKAYPEYDPIVRTTWAEDKNEAKKEADDPWSFYDCFYFALVTQTTVGYGDLVPRTRLMRHICLCQLLTIYGVLALSWI